MGSSCTSIYKKNNKENNRKVVDSGHKTPQNTKINDDPLSNNKKNKKPPENTVITDPLVKPEKKPQAIITSPINITSPNVPDPKPNTDFQSPKNNPKKPLIYKKGHLIGKGSFGEVYESLNMNTGELLAVKTVKIAGNKERAIKYIESLKKEITLLKTLSHKNIVKYYGTEVSEQKDEVDIILEYVSGGSVKYLLDKFKRLDERVISLYTRQILEGLVYLHENGIIHRDIKGANILIDANATAKLTDFGCSKKLDKLTDQDNPQENNSSLLPKSIQGSPYWIAPEVIMKKSSGKPADIWSVGCVVIEMLTGIPPWSDITNDLTNLYKLITGGGLPAIPSNLSENCRDFIYKTLKFKPEERPTAAELLEHSFIKDCMLLKVDSSNSYMSSQYTVENIESYARRFPLNGQSINTMNGIKSQNSANHSQFLKFFEKDRLNTESEALKFKNNNAFYEKYGSKSLPLDNNQLGGGIARTPKKHFTNIQPKKFGLLANPPDLHDFDQSNAIPLTVSTVLKYQNSQERVEEVSDEDQYTATRVKNVNKGHNIDENMKLGSPKKSPGNSKIFDFNDTPAIPKLENQLKEEKEFQKKEAERIKAEKRKKWEEELRMELFRKNQQENNQDQM